MRHESLSLQEKIGWVVVIVVFTLAWLALCTGCWSLAAGLFR